MTKLFSWLRFFLLPVFSQISRYLSLFVFTLVSLLLWPSSGVSVWHHCSDFMGIVKQVISSIRSRTKEKIEDLNCEYEMIWDAEGSMHLVKKALGTPIARSSERNSVERFVSVLHFHTQLVCGCVCTYRVHITCVLSYKLLWGAPHGY